MVAAAAAAAAVIAVFAWNRSPDSADCRTQVDDLRAWLETLVEEGIGSLPGGGKDFELVRIDWDGPVVSPDRRGPLVMIRPDGFLIMGLRVADAAELEAELAAERDRHPGDAGEVHEEAIVFFVIDAEATWQQVEEAASAAVAAGLSRGAIVFETPWELEPPPSAIDDHIEEFLSPGRRAKDLGALRERGQAVFDEVYGDCPAARAAFEARVADHATMSFADHEAWLVEDLPAAIERCGCRVELASVKAYQWMEAGRPQPVRVGLPVTFAGDDEAGADALRAAGTSPWAETHPLILQAIDAGADRIALRAEHDSGAHSP